jgi:hypothetical protein
VLHCSIGTDRARLESMKRSIERFEEAFDETRDGWKAKYDRGVVVLLMFLEEEIADAIEPFVYPSTHSLE